MFHVEQEDDGPLPPDKWRNCGGCGERFWSKVQRLRPTYVPLFCATCDARNGEKVRAWDEEHRRKRREKMAERAAKKGKRKKKAKTLADVAEILAGFSPPKKSAK